VAEAAEDYYTGKGEAEGRWLGEIATELGLSGKVQADQLEAMLTGNNPATGDPLGLRAVGGRGAVPGFDLTFSIPKSASLLWALGDERTSAAVSAALDRAHEAAMDYLQREACWTRRGAEAEFVKGSGFLAAGFRHRTSRAGDPQLHVHTLIANATQGPDGKWTRLYHPAIYDHAKTAGYLFEASFRHELTQSLGVNWQEVRNGIAEIEGFADQHLREFSTRRREILEAVGPASSARAREVATLATRTAKEEGLTPGTLRERWQAKATEIDLDVAEIGHTFSPTEHGQVRAATDAEVAATVTEGISHFDRRDAIQAVAQLAREGMEAAEVERAADAFLASKEVIALGETAKGERFTTPRIWEIERSALARVEKMKTAGAGVAGEAAYARAVALNPSLKADQREMVRRMLTDPAGVTVVIGEAGTGKTFATAVAARAWAEQGIPLRAAAPTWRAANELRAEGIEATSIAGLLVRLDNSPPGKILSPGSVLLIDEAGMVDSSTLAWLIFHAQAAQAHLVLVGDYEQLSEIEAGGLFRAIAEHSDPVVLDQVIRHHHDIEREGAKLIREGEGDQALALYRSAERVVVAADAEARRELMVSEWQRSYESGEDAVMIAKRNAEVDHLNQIARERLAEAGRLGEEVVIVGTEPFAAGDLVITRVNDRAAEVYNRERWQVAEVDAAQRRVTLEGIDQTRRVELGEEYLARVNEHSEAPALQHAYAVTTYSAQGATVDRAFVAADASMDKQELYVAASRSREETFLYVTPEIQVSRAEFARVPSGADLSHISQAASRDRAQRAAHDVAKEAELRKLSDEQLQESRFEAGQKAQAEERHENEIERATRFVEMAQNNVDRHMEKYNELIDAPWRQRRRELPEVEASGDKAFERLDQAKERLADLGSPSHEARAHEAMLERIGAERERAMTAALALEREPYIQLALGERPQDRKQARAWDRGATEIERYREKHGITDPERPFGPEPTDPGARQRQREASEHLERTQRELGHEIGVERDIGIDLAL
jgi:conjugative relaxase-like TrwC/TraI family protein